ncbi:DEAD/DEAH box helicase, partial [Salmonella enterica]|nr:DEAD/DEAH box helicase [Salmonella enterica]
NQAIAQQNLNRLNVIGKEAMALPTRITLVPLQLRGDDSLASNKVNFISLTPGTTFNLKSTTGVINERALLVRLLEPFASFTPLRNALQVGAGDDNWDWHVEHMTLEGVDTTIVRRFRAAIERSNKLQCDLAEVC